MIPLRVFAIVSNVLFCSYGYIDHLYPVLFLHAILFPVNLLRLQHLIRKALHTRQEGESIPRIPPYVSAGSKNLQKQGTESGRAFARSFQSNIP